MLLQAISGLTPLRRPSPRGSQAGGPEVVGGRSGLSGQVPGELESSGHTRAPSTELGTAAHRPISSVHPTNARAHCDQL